MSEDKAALIKTAYSYYQRADWDRAIEEYHKLGEIDPNDLNVHNMLADIYSKKGDIPEALQQYDLVAQGYDQKNQVEKVLQVYKRMLKLAPGDPELANAGKGLLGKYLDRAARLAEQGDEKAGDIYRSIIRAEPGLVEASLQYAKMLTVRGRKFEAVEALLNLAGNMDPDTQAARLAEVLHSVNEIDPLNVEAHENLSGLLEKGGQTDLAVKNLQDLVEIYLGKNDLNKAEEAARKAIGLGDASSYYHLGVIQFNQQKYAESRASFETFLKGQESHVGALKYLALTCLRLGENGPAVEVYLRVLGIYFNENLLEEAREIRDTVLELDPDNQAVKKHDLGQGNQVLDAPLEAPPSGPRTAEGTGLGSGQQKDLLSEAEGFIEKGLYEQAVDVYLDMLKRWPDLPEIRVRLQQVYGLMARSMEPAVKFPSPEEVKAELEQKLQEQMKRELEEQAKAALERHRELERKSEEERAQLRRELESKLQDQVQKSSREEELRQQLARELEEKQRQLEEERKRLEEEKNVSIDRLRNELEEARQDLERNMREQIERETRERIEKESLLQAALLQEQEKDRREEEQRQQYAASKRQKDSVRDKINQEIMQGMERLRRERDPNHVEPVPPPVLSIEEEETAAVPEPSLAPETLEDPFIRQTLADIYARQGLYVEALKIYEKILNEEPNNEDVREKLRGILKMKGM